MTKLDLTITLKAIRNAYPCTRGWKKLLAGLGYAGGNYDPDRVVSLGDVALINDAAGALRCVRALDWNDIHIRRAVISGAVLPAVKRASKHTKDARVHDAIAALTRWCAGDDTVDLLATTTAADAANYAAYAAAYAVHATGAYGREQQRQDIIAAFPPVATNQ